MKLFAGDCSRNRTRQNDYGNARTTAKTWLAGLIYTKEALINENN